MNYGYVRVSTINQNIDRQLDDLYKLGLDDKHIYIDKESGKDFNRKNYLKLLKKLKEKDVLYIKSIDRLGRNYSMIIDEWKTITKERNIDIVVLDMPLLDTRIKNNNLVGIFIADLVLQILSFVAENEREMIRKRQTEGIRIAKLKGIKFGRPKIELPNNINEIIQKYQNKEINSKEACFLSGLSRGTFFRAIKAIKIN